MKKHVYLLLSLFLFLNIVAVINAEVDRRDSAWLMADAAARLLQTLNEGQRAKVLLSFDSEERFDWAYIHGRNATAFLSGR